MISSPLTGWPRAWPLLAGMGWVAAGLAAAVVVTYIVCLLVGRARLVDVRQAALVGLGDSFLRRLVGGREDGSPVVLARTGKAPAAFRMPTRVFR